MTYFEWLYADFPNTYDKVLILLAVGFLFSLTPAGTGRWFWR